MILRRVIENLRQQHWMAVLIELAIVVLGVFIGLQVDNWNDARHDRVLEQQYIERLYRDMAGSVDDMREEAVWNENLIKGQDVVLKALRSGRLPEEDRQSFESGLALLGYVSSPRVRWSTVDELQTTGNMTILRDVALRELVGRTRAEFDRKMGIDRAVASRIEAFRQRMDGKFGVMDVRAVSVEGIRLDYDFPALAADREFVNLASQAALNAHLKKLNCDNEIGEIENLRDELGKRLPAPRNNGARP